MKKCGACGDTFVEARIQPAIAEERTLSVLLTRKEISAWEEVCTNCGSNDIERITHELEWRTEKPPDSPRGNIATLTIGDKKINVTYYRARRKKFNEKEIQAITSRDNWEDTISTDGFQRAIRLGMFNSVRFNGQYI
ncbi:hypothetical protein L8C07_12450 [Paenibacillus sp. CMAA1739]|uniref:hypothetical protein n=1 Tax=Paenibacillus ottowii TaxID=2315729 RepID=UPI002DBC2831|nr:hypothetical protein [Paenibacillus sp. CMAA1739]MEC4566758.1 hypothetical protein [Paenibacillus sp. CMAA1739]